jgi:hypothetical protein
MAMAENPKFLQLISFSCLHHICLNIKLSTTMIIIRNKFNQQTNTPQVGLVFQMGVLGTSTGAATQSACCNHSAPR